MPLRLLVPRTVIVHLEYELKCSHAMEQHHCDLFVDRKERHHLNWPSVWPENLTTPVFTVAL